MPLPPFHLGPGAAAKVLGGHHFSFSIFAFSQVLMDIEPLARIYADSAALHGFTNTLLGATVVGACSALIGKPVCEKALWAWNQTLTGRGARWFGVDSRISRGSAIVSAGVGVYVHADLDAIMHSDAQPWLPFAAGNPLIGLLSVRDLHLLCVGMGTFGLICLIWNTVMGPPPK